ncbi:hypothetical protein NDU88_002168 [Pleurodeles waltl]|uniref:Uncharacterized protein n=1 Tax=Pleurodeles waltl TaxID=8319 RepID=A0AAV7REW2_PLEWA|nr:hypothetical protein NDU88_002168 [Pleurodeles waltl]
MLGLTAQQPPTRLRAGSCLSPALHWMHRRRLQPGEAGRQRHGSVGRGRAPSGEEREVLRLQHCAQGRGCSPAPPVSRGRCPWPDLCPAALSSMRFTCAERASSQSAWSVRRTSP